MTNQRTRRTKIRVCGVCFLFAAVSTALIGLSASAIAQNPVPSTNQPLVPDTISPGGMGFTLTVNGTGFVPASVVKWNGIARATTYVNGSQLKAAILASDISIASTASVTVVNYSPGGGTSDTLFFPIRAPEASVSFGKSDFTSAGGNIQVVAADFDGDGKLDLASADYYGSVVRIFLGNGDGTFRVGETYAACLAHGLSVGDVNGDGIADLVVADAGCGEVTILLGNGDGTFMEGGSFSTGGGATLAPYSVAVGDFNGDGKLDLVTADETLNKASVLIGNGDGTFQAEVDYATGSDSRKVVTGDFNRDGHLDFAISSSAGVSVVLGNGDGTFQPQIFYSLATHDNPYILTADLNGDGRLDLAVANTAGSVSILLGKGDGTFNGPTVYATGGFSAAVASADLNGDGFLDLVTTNYYTQNVSVLLGKGDGTFGTRIDFPAGYGARGLAVADFDKDGRLDLAVGNQFVDSISMFLGASSVVSSTSTDLTSSLNPSIYGQRVTWTATVLTTGPVPPTGIIHFKWNGNSIGRATLNSSGVATLSRSNLNADSFPLVAVYTGDASNLGSTSSVVNQLVTPTSSSAMLSSSPNPSTTGQTVTFTATITSPTVTPTGPVTFAIGTTVLGTGQLSGGKAKFTTSTLTLGSSRVTATYHGNSNIAKSSASVTQTVH